MGWESTFARYSRLLNQSFYLISNSAIHPFYLVFNITGQYLNFQDLSCVIKVFLRWPVWLSDWSVGQSPEGSGLDSQSRAGTWIASLMPGPSLGACRRQTINQCVSLT